MTSTGYMRNDCLLTYPLLAYAFRDLSNDGWREIVESGAFDDFIKVVDASAYLPTDLARFLSN